ncbi:DUF983 domain-containing protein [Dyadobacter sp. 32]|uniref:DUF983 domain-containing protein n=1 Tax=Dyadobacter sp. 32 TaxID=538966 RepID=UPI0011F00BCA
MSNPEVLKPVRQGTRLESIARLKCPRCRKGDLFITKNPYHLKQGLDMHEKCPVCHQDFKIEPGFYIGALWASFPIVILFMAILSVILLVGFKLSLTPFFVIISIVLFLLQPLIIRWGRSIWINIFVRYDARFPIR